MIRIRPNDRSVLPLVWNAPNRRAVRDIRRWCFQAARKLRLPGLPLIISFYFAKLPKGLFGFTQIQGSIQLDRGAWVTMTRRAQRRLVIHELCHVVEYVRHGTFSEHGVLFQRTMRRAGLKPNSTDIPEKQAA